MTKNNPELEDTGMSKWLEKKGSQHGYLEDAMTGMGFEEWSSWTDDGQGRWPSVSMAASWMAIVADEPDFNT